VREPRRSLRPHAIAEHVPQIKAALPKFPAPSDGMPLAAVDGEPLEIFPSSTA
jgi:hypothetical protein